MKNWVVGDPAKGKTLGAFLKSTNKAFGDEQSNFSFELDESSSRTILQWSNQMGILIWESI